MRICLLLLIIFLNLQITQTILASLVEDDMDFLERKVETISLSAAPLLKEGSPLSPEEHFIQEIIRQDYDRDLVTRFIHACPSQKNLSYSTEISEGTLSKLKSPEVYGKLEPSAQRLWSWLQSKGIEGLKNELKLKDKAIKGMARSLSLLDLSNSAIVYDELGEDLRSEGNLGRSRFHVVSEVVNYLNHMKGTFRALNLAHNLLADEGLKMIVEELRGHDLLEDINIRDNKISDVGLRSLLALKHLKKIDISKNFGPGDETCKLLKALNDSKVTVIVH